MFLQLTETQATDEDLFGDDGSQNAVDNEMIRQFLAPRAVDGFLDLGTDDISNAGEVVEDVGVFPIPRELLVTLPIAEVGPNTKIIHNPYPQTWPRGKLRS